MDIIYHHDPNDNFVRLPELMKEIQTIITMHKLNDINDFISVNIKGNKTIMHSTHPYHIHYPPNEFDWTYKGYLMNEEKFSSLSVVNKLERKEFIYRHLLQQFQDYMDALPMSYQYRVTQPMTVYKKVRIRDTKIAIQLEDIVVISIIIPKDAIVNECIIGNHKGKCRANVAYTLFQPGLSGIIKTFESIHAPNFIYPNVDGHLLKSNYEFNTSLNACSNGIHFFKTYQEAMDLLNFKNRGKLYHKKISISSIDQN